MSFYYPCEISGELRLLSSLCLFEDKIVTNRVAKSIQKERRKEERKKANQAKKIASKAAKMAKKRQKQQQKQQQKLEEREARKQQLIQRRKEERGLTPLQIKVRRGEISWDEYVELHQDPITQEERDTVAEEYARHINMGKTHEDAKRFAEHFALYRRYLKKSTKDEVAEFMNSDAMKVAIEMMLRGEFGDVFLK